MFFFFFFFLGGGGGGVVLFLRGNGACRVYGLIGMWWACRGLQSLKGLRAFEGFLGL